MRFLSFEHRGLASFGCLVDGGICDLGRRSGLPDLASYIGRHGTQIETVTDLRPDVDPAEIRYLPPIPRPSKILCIATNYREPAAEQAPIPAYPLVFTRFAASQTGHDEPLLKPAESEMFDYEGELAVIMGRPGWKIPEDEALSHVAGYSCFNDGSVRDWQKHSSQFTPGKNFIRTAGFGPWMVSADQLPDPTGLRLETRVNGEVRQASETSRFIFGIPWLIAYFSRFTILEPGDVIVTGTPTGFGSSRQPPQFLQVGDTVEVEIEGIGTLRNIVGAPPSDS